MAPAGFALTFLCVVAAMALFRASSVTAAVLLWKGMIGGYGVTLPQAVFPACDRRRNGLPRSACIQPGPAAPC
jgi:hypothetical protein